MKCAYFAILCCTLFLAGCSSWSGPVFYTSEGRAGWLPPGTYRSIEDGKSAYFRWDGKQITDLPSGKKEKKDAPLPTMVPLSGANLEAYIAQLEIGAEDGRKSALYALVSRTGNVWTFVAPDCATTRRIVLDAGGIIDGAVNVSVEDPASVSRDRQPKHHRSSRHAPPEKIVRPDRAENQYGSLACHFPTRASLEAAARRYLAERQLIGNKIIRLGD